jgi:hypothetical protein
VIRKVAIYTQISVTKQQKNQEFHELSENHNPVESSKPPKTQNEGNHAQSIVLVAVPPAPQDRADGAITQHAVERARRALLLAAHAGPPRKRVLLGVLRDADGRLRRGEDLLGPAGRAAGRQPQRERFAAPPALQPGDSADRQGGRELQYLRALGADHEWRAAQHRAAVVRPHPDPTAALAARRRRGGGGRGARVPGQALGGQRLHELRLQAAHHAGVAPSHRARAVLTARRAHPRRAGAVPAPVRAAARLVDGGDEVPEVLQRLQEVLLEPRVAQRRRRDVRRVEP